MPRDVTHVRLGGVRATRLHASGIDDSRLLLKVRARAALVRIPRNVHISRVSRDVALSRYSHILTRTHIHTAER